MSVRLWDVLILLYKLRKTCFSVNTIAWFRSFLTHTQIVKCGDMFSAVLDIKTEIGQGTIFGTIHFHFLCQ